MIKNSLPLPSAPHFNDALKDAAVSKLLRQQFIF